MVSPWVSPRNTRVVGDAPKGDVSANDRIPGSKTETNLSVPKFWGWATHH